MLKIFLAGLIVICAGVIVVSFFMPWAKANVNVTKVAADLTTAADTKLKATPFAGMFIKGFGKATSAIGKLGDIEVKTAVSGYDIPVMVNKKSSQIALAIIQILVKDAKDLDKKSLLVFLLPLFAIVCAVLAMVGFKNLIAIIAMTVISGAISIGGLYNLMTANLSAGELPIKVTIEMGLWQTMYGYLLIFAMGIAWIASVLIAKKK